MDGQFPDLWSDTSAPDGDAGDWANASRGSIYVQRARTSGQTVYEHVWVKRKNDKRDDDWGNLGGIHCLSQRIAYTDFTDGLSTSGTKALTETIPAGAWVIQTLLENVTGFTGDVSATILVGDGTDTDRYSTGTPSVFTTATAIDLGVPSGTKVHTAEKTVTVTVTSGSDWGLVVAGAMTVNIFYLL